MTYTNSFEIANRVTAEASRRTWAVTLRVFAVSKGLIGFLFGIMLVPVQAGVAFGKGATGKASHASRALRKAALGKPVTATHNLLTWGSTHHNAPAVDSSLLSEFSQSLITYAHTLIGRPYRSGGKIPSSGFDCSGFTGYVFKQFGIGLPSCSRTQSTVGAPVKKEAAKAGDLVFFGRKTRLGTQIYHTGIVASNQKGHLRVIHSATGEGVTVTDMSQPGYWRNHLVSVRRVIQHPEALLIAAQ